MKHTIYGLLFASAIAFAQPPNKPTIIFFGGYRSTAAQMKTWEDGNRASSGGERYNFIGVPYPSPLADPNEGLRAGQQLIKQYANYIKAHPNDQFILTGHSSGGVLPTAVADLLPPTANVRLVIFDGSNWAAHLQDRFPTMCFSGINPMDACTNRFVFKAPGCDSGYKWCLHFRMINANAAANLTSIDHGYDGFQPYTQWLTAQ